MPSLTARCAPSRPVPTGLVTGPVARQPIVTRQGGVVGYEFLYRSPSGRPARVDHWRPRDQDGATTAVLARVFGLADAPALAPSALAFVNVTRAVLVGALPLPDRPDRLVLEVVESVEVDGAVVRGVRALADRGFRVALDDFTGRPGQLALLPWASYVKIDARDLDRHGDELVALARRHDAALIAERIEDAGMFARCVALGFALFQGHLVQPAVLMHAATSAAP